MNFVPGESGSVGERLANVVLFQIRQLLDNLCRRHPVGDKVDDVRDGDAKSADGPSPAEDVGIMRNPIKCVRHRHDPLFTAPRSMMKDRARGFRRHPLDG